MADSPLRSFSPTHALWSSLPPSSPLSSAPSSPSVPLPSLFAPQFNFPQTPGPRAVSLPPLSSDGLIPTSPIRGTREERRQQSHAKGLRKRAITLQIKEQLAVQAHLQKEKEDEEAAEVAEDLKHSYFSSLLEGLQDRGYSLAELLVYVSDPVFKQGRARWEGLFQDRASVSKILDLWAFKSSPASQLQVRSWAVRYIAQAVKREARLITASKFLQTLGRRIDANLILDFKMSSMRDHLQEHASILMTVLESAVTSVRQLKSAPAVRLAKKMTVITSAALTLLGEYSYNNNWGKKAMGLYFYSTGSQRQPISVMSHLGVSESYDAITTKKRKRRRKKNTRVSALSDGPPPPPSTADTPDLLKGGSLRQLSESMVDMARVVASTGLFATSYDNINMVFRAAEQIVGRTDAQENGTCATVWPLFKAAIQDMQVADLEKSFDAAPPLSASDVLLNSAESCALNTHLHHCILRIIITHGGEKFKKFKTELERTTPTTTEKIELHKTPLHPLPAFDIDESTIIGGAEVVDAVFDVLWIRRITGWLKIVKFFCGDQLTIARLRSLVNIRAGHEGGFSGFGWGVWIPGLFHAKMADIHGLFTTHWGKPAAGPRNPGCLAFHNTVLQRKPILLTSLPPFRTCRDLIFVSLYARVLHCLLLVSNTGSLEEYVEAASWETLSSHAHGILDQFANPDIVSDLRWQRKRTSGAVASADLSQESTSRAGDMVFENAILFLRDALLSREFTDAVKAGDSGRVVLVLKIWALSFRGSGRSKYAHEMLHLIHNISHVWPKPIRDIVFNNWLVNLTGNPYSWVEVDLMQEHMNFWIKDFYHAHGSAASWEWLEMVAPCVEVLRQLARNFKQMLGTDLGITHQPMDLSVDIPDLMDSLEDYEVYSYKQGRYLDDDDSPVTDVISVGLSELHSGRSSPLAEYNTAFQRLQARRRLMPLVGEPQISVPTTASVVSSLAVPAEKTVHPTIEFNLGIDNEDDEDMDEGEGLEEFDDEELSEYLQAFDDGIRATLALETAADVSLDMDAEDLGSGGLGGFLDEELLDNFLDDFSEASDDDGDPNLFS